MKSAIISDTSAMIYWRTALSNDSLDRMQKPLPMSIHILFKSIR